MKAERPSNSGSWTRPRQGHPRAIAGLALLGLLVGLGTGGCGGKKQSKAQTISMMSAQEIYDQSVRELQQADLGEAQSLLEQVNYSAEERDELEPLVRLSIADATFYESSSGLNLIDARSLYQDFVALYGAHPLAPYAQMQAGVCSLLQVANPSRDQTLTHQAVADLRVTGQRWPDSVFARAARTMMDKAESNLAEHEFIVGKFYLNRKAPLAALDRFQRIVDRYPHYREMDKIYYYLGRAQLKLGNDDEARVYLDKLLREYPDGEFVRGARRELSKYERQGGKFDLEGSD